MTQSRPALMPPRLPVISLLLVISLPVPSRTAVAPDDVDLHAVYRIKQEGLNNSQVMNILSWLTDVHGPRLTGSPNLRAAAEWTVEIFREWGMEARLENWGEFGRGWSNERVVLHVVEPQDYPVIGFPKA